MEKPLLGCRIADEEEATVGVEAVTDSSHSSTTVCSPSPKASNRTRKCHKRPPFQQENIGNEDDQILHWLLSKTPLRVRLRDLYDTRQRCSIVSLTDFTHLAASLFTHWPHLSFPTHTVGIPPSTSQSTSDNQRESLPHSLSALHAAKSISLPPSKSTSRLSPSNLTPQLKSQSNLESQIASIRKLVAAMQTLRVTSKLPLSVKNHKFTGDVLALALSIIIRSPIAAAEALAPLFFVAESGEAATKPLRDHLLRWSRSGFLQDTFEVFVIATLKAKRYRALLAILASLPIFTHLLSPILAKDPHFAEDPIPGYTRCRTEVLLELKFPVVVCLVLLKYVLTRDIPLLDYRGVFLSLLAVVCCKVLCEKHLVHKKWHLVSLNEKETSIDIRSVTSRLECVFQSGNGCDFQIDRCLEKVISGYVFEGRFLCRESEKELLPQGFESEGEWKNALEVWRKLQESGQAVERYFTMLELWSRLVETFLLADIDTPVNDLLELGDRTTSESILEVSVRRIAELTGCHLRPVELYLMRLIEASDAKHGVASNLPGLRGPPRKFRSTLAVSPYLFSCILAPLSGLPPSIKCCPNILCQERDPDPSYMPPVTATGAILPEGGASALVYPTLLPPHLAKFFPAWFATRGNLVSSDPPKAYDVWRTLCLEMLAVASFDHENAPFHSIIAPHLLEDRDLFTFVQLYTDCANPRALHLLTRLIQPNGHRSQVLLTRRTIKELLQRAKNAKFSLLADAMAQVITFDDKSSADIADLIVQIYLVTDHPHDAHSFLNGLNTSNKALAKLKAKWAPLLPTPPDDLPKEDPQSPLTLPLQDTISGKSVGKWHQRTASLKTADVAEQTLKESLAMVHDMLNGPDGVPDILIANKLINVCISSGKLNEAESLFQRIRKDASNKGTVHPDVVTCNIMLKGWARQKPPRLEEMEKLLRDMEREKIPADGVTYNTIINAAVAAGSCQKAWTLFEEMKAHGIRVDGFTCSALIKQIGPSTKPEFISEILQNLQELDPIEDPILLSSVVDLYTRLRYFDRLDATLVRYEETVPMPTAYAIAALVKGYGRCGRMDRATTLWKGLESTPGVVWTPFIIGCGIDSFLASGALNLALSIFDRADAAGVSVNETQYLNLIKACIQACRLSDAYKVYNQMREAGHSPCDVVYNDLLHMCVAAGEIDTAVEILNDMSTNVKHQPDVITYSTIIKGLCDKGLTSLAMQLFKSISAKGVQPDTVTYNTLIEGFAKADDAEHVEAYFTQMISNKVKPSCCTLTILLKFYGRRKMIDEALALVENLPAAMDIKIDAFVYTAIIAACSWNGRVRKAVEFLERMRTEFDVSSRTYGTLLAGCLREQNWTCLSAVLTHASEDNVSLGKRDLSNLKDLLHDWDSNSLSNRWVRSGFDAVAAHQLRIFLRRNIFVK